MSEDRPDFELGAADVAGRRFAIIASAFNEEVVRRLLEGARECFAKHGVEDGAIDVYWTPGAFELPLVAKRALQTGRFDAAICLGAVIRGETAHFEFVAGQAAAGIGQVGLETGSPVIFGVLTTDTVEQAKERSGGDRGNKGWDSALAALQMVKLLDQLDRRETKS